MNSVATGMKGNDSGKTFMASKLTWPQKSHECALKLTDLWIKSLLFDLNYKLINWSFGGWGGGGGWNCDYYY